MKLPSLKVLWLHDNPCALTDHYREIVIHHLPNLVKLDNNIITQEEKNISQNGQFSILEGHGREHSTVERGFRQSEERSLRPSEERIPRGSEERRSRPYSEMREEKQ